MARQPRRRAAGRHKARPAQTGIVVLLGKAKRLDVLSQDVDRRGSNA